MAMLQEDDLTSKTANEPDHSPNTIRERLSRMFDENVRPKRRRSTDFMGAVKHTLHLHGDAAKIRSTSSEIMSHRSAAASVHSLPLKDVPDRHSSLANSQQASLQDFPSWRLPPIAAAGKTIPHCGRADSPVKRSIAKDPVSSDTIRSRPSRTFIRPIPPLRLIEAGIITHRRVQLLTHLKAPLFLGGGTIEGQIKLAVDQDTARKAKSQPLLISKLSVDVVGLEETSEGKK